MGFTVNRKVAVLVLAAVICVFTYIGVNRSVSALAGDIEDSFYTGAENAEGYTEASIQSHLDNRIDAANGLCTMAAQYPGMSDAVNSLQSARYELMEKSRDDITGKFQANEKLTESADALVSLLEAQDLSQDQQQMLDYYTSTLEGAENAIGKLSYNTAVDEFYNRTLKSFPVSLFSPLLSVEGPEYFK